MCKVADLVTEGSEAVGIAHVYVALCADIDAGADVGAGGAGVGWTGGLGKLWKRVRQSRKNSSASFQGGLGLQYRPRVWKRLRESGHLPGVDVEAKRRFLRQHDEGMLAVCDRARIG